MFKYQYISFTLERMTVYKNNKTPNVSRKKLIWLLKKVSILSLFTCSTLKNVNKTIQHVSSNIN